MATGPKSADLPWSNCRLLLASEADEDSDLPQGIVGRLYFSPVSHPAVRQSWQGLTPGYVLIKPCVLRQKGFPTIVGEIFPPTRESSKLINYRRRS
jgi:hypothetical protein